MTRTFFTSRLDAYKVFAKTPSDLEFLAHLQSEANNMDIAVEKPSRSMNSSMIFTSPDCNKQKILSMMSQHHISDFEVFNPRFKRDPAAGFRRFNDFTSPIDPEIVTKRYLSQDEANIYIDELAARIRKANPNLSVEVFVEGQSFEKRAIKSIFVQYRSRPGNPYVFVDAGIHAREWHARSMGLYLLKKLAEEAAKDQKGLLYSMSFIIVPSLNPDGS